MSVDLSLKLEGDDLKRYQEVHHKHVMKNMRLKSEDMEKKPRFEITAVPIDTSKEVLFEVDNEHRVMKDELDNLDPDLIALLVSYSNLYKSRSIRKLRFFRKKKKGDDSK